MGLDCEIHLEEQDNCTGETYFKLEYNGEQIISITSGEEKEGKINVTHNSDFNTHGIYYGILGLTMALINDHKITKVFPWLNIIDKDGKSANSMPLFTPICTVGCCGYEDIEILLKEQTVIIKRSNGKQWDIPLSEYIDVIVKCINEVLRCFKYDANKGRGEYDFKPYAWFLVWLAAKVALESSENVRTLFKPQISIILDDWGMFLG